ncbi:MAG: DeoR/GlpR transcriptional regulator [Selenomonadaceae bacterium]|nr:DeoR/GlpR transcriptional regulator [Selenomonadaceae bacterium]
MKNNQKAVQKRRQNILQMVIEKGEITVGDIAKSCNISEMTVRRDLQIMEDRKLLYRIHGGASSLERVDEVKRFGENVNLCRNRISAYASKYVQDGDSLFINGSRTALNMLKYINNKKVLVHTNNGWAINEKYPEGVTVCLTGGEVRNHVMVGEYVMRYLLSITVDKIFIGCAAVYDDGEFRYDIPTEIGINESMISRNNHKIYVLADHSKFQQRENNKNLYGSTTYERQIVLITDEKTDPTMIEKLRQSGMEIVIVPLK